MNVKKIIQSLFLSLLLLTLLPACTENAKRESTGEYLDDTVLTTKIKATFLGDSRLKMFDINVKTFKGVVQLSGFIDSQKESDRAADLARRIKGVKEVHNDILIKQ